jgi:hypothetical protein
MSQLSVENREYFQGIQTSRKAIVSLNARFLELLAIDSHAQSWPTISRIVSAHPGCIPPLLAACPFALFDVRFQDQQAWTSLSEHRRDQSHALRPGECAGKEILNAACFLAWILAHQSPPRARLLLGASSEVISILESIDLVLIQRLAPDWLQPRWCERPAVWAELVRLAIDERSGFTDTLRTRALSLQLGDIIA